MTLDGLERELRKQFPKKQKALVNFVRYADDCVPRRLIEKGGGRAELYER
jgi:hypothetical protein